MSFNSDVDQTPGLESARRPGLQALKKADRARVDPGRTELLGSVDVDGALRQRFPNDARWDYLVAVAGSRRTEVLHWIEVHPAGSGSSIAEVLAKAQWLMAWLAGEGRRLDRRPRQLVWIASGKTAIPGNSPGLRRLAALGVAFAGRVHSLAPGSVTPPRRSSS